MEKSSFLPRQALVLNHTLLQWDELLRGLWNHEALMPPYAETLLPELRTKDSTASPSSSDIQCQEPMPGFQPALSTPEFVVWLFHLGRAAQSDITLCLGGQPLKAFFSTLKPLTSAFQFFK